MENLGGNQMKLLSGGDHHGRFRRSITGLVAGILIVGSIIPETAIAVEAASPEWGTEWNEEGLIERNAIESEKETEIQAYSEKSSEAESLEQQTEMESSEVSSKEETISSEETEDPKNTENIPITDETTEQATMKEVEASASSKTTEELEKEIADQREAMNQVHKDMSTIIVDEEEPGIALMQDNEEDLQRQRSAASADLARLNSLAAQSKALSQSKSGTIRQCEIVSVNGDNRISVTASLPATITGTVYLMELNSYEYSLAGKTPVAQAAASSSVTMQVSLGSVQGSDSKLFSKFVVATKNPDGSYTAVTAPSYITNPGVVAANTFAFPITSSKKGLQANATMVEDSVELGVKHVAVNFCIDQMISQNGGIAYNYKGKTYYFNQSYINAYDALLRSYYENNIQVSFIVLLGNNKNAEGLLYEAALDTGKYSPNNYALDTSNKEDAEWVEAIMTFLGSRYTRTDGQNGQIVNWILGNELNTPMYYNWMGSVSFDTYVNELTRTYRIFTTALKSCYSNVRTYLSFDYCWGSIPNNTDIAFSTREILDSMDDIIELEGDINWNIAYHAYPFMLKDPVFWDDDAAVVNDSEDSRIVNMKNIQVLTDYVEKNFGKDTRIILSEQGFSCDSTNNQNSQMKQAASYAYGYYISESCDMIDAFIIRAHVDNRIETNQGFYFGLWTNKDGEIEVANQKRELWEVVKYIDTSSTFEYTNPLLPWVDCVDAWDNTAPRLENFDPNKFQNIDGSTNDGLPTIASISYSAHVQNKGWMPYVEADQKAGTTGENLRVESFKIKLDTNVDGGVSYAAHVQNKGWMTPVTDGQSCGTTGKSLRVEALWIRLTGELEKEYDVYYRAHIQNEGWLGWASNGSYAGSLGRSLRMEAFQIKLVKKGAEAPSSTKAAYVK